jgi:DNA/RNA-binding domain of Phe-tRNA-synthetase-like protein
VAALDVTRIAWPLQVRFAQGTEHYSGIGGDDEAPELGEVSFVDAEGQAHARRWTHRQSGNSAVRETTSDALIVMEAVHPAARGDVDRLSHALGEAIGETWKVKVALGQLSTTQQVFSFG